MAGGGASGGRQTRSTAAAAAAADPVGGSERRKSQRQLKKRAASDDIQPPPTKGQKKGGESATAKSAGDDEKNERIYFLLDVLDGPSYGSANDKDGGDDDDDDDADDSPPAKSTGSGNSFHDYLVEQLKAYGYDKNRTKPSGMIADRYYELTAAEQANMPTEDQLVRLPGPDRNMILVARSQIEKELLALISGNPNPPQLAIVRERGKEEVLRKCPYLWTSLGPKVRKAHKEGKMTDEEKDALLEASAKQSVQGAVGGKANNLTVAAIKAANKAKKPIRSKFDIELVDASNKTAVERYLALGVADGAEERLAQLREEANTNCPKNDEGKCTGGSGRKGNAPNPFYIGYGVSETGEKDESVILLKKTGTDHLCDEIIDGGVGRSRPSITEKDFKPVDPSKPDGVKFAVIHGVFYVERHTSKPKKEWGKAIKAERLKEICSEKHAEAVRQKLHYKQQRMWLLK